MICENCGVTIFEQHHPVMFIKHPNREAVAYCLDSVDCAETGAASAIVTARRETSGMPYRDAEIPVVDQ